VTDLAAAGIGIRVSGTAVTLEPLSSEHEELLRPVAPALLAKLHVLGAWTGRIPPDESKQTRALLEQFGAKVEVVDTEAKIATMLAAMEPLPPNHLVGLDIETHDRAGGPSYLVHTTKRGAIAKEQPVTRRGARSASAPLDPFRAAIRTVQIYWGTGTVYVVDLRQVDPELLAPVWSCQLVVHNAAFEASMLRQVLGVELTRVVDTLFGAGLVLRGELSRKHEGRRRMPLAVAYKELTGLVIPKSGGASDWSRPVLSRAQIEYAGLDAVLAWDLGRKLVGRCRTAEPGRQEPNLLSCWRICNRAIQAAVDIELHGIAIDRPALARIAANWVAEKERLAAEIRATLGIKATSSPEKARWLRRELPPSDLRSWPRTKTGTLSTKGKHLQRLVGQVPGVELLVEHARIGNLNANYGFGLLELLHPVTGRLHPRFQLAAAKTGRASTPKPNMMAFPGDPQVRSCVIAPPGRRLVGGDWSQLELRILGEITQDPALRAMFVRGEDVHSATAAALHGIPLCTFDPDHDPQHKAWRRAAKAINFGIAYGAMAPGIVVIARDQHGVIMTEQEAETYRLRWLALRPGVARWHETHVEVCRRSGTVRTLGGRRHLFSWEPFGSFRATLAKNLPVQGSAAEIAMTTMARLHQRLPLLTGDARLLLQVHDEFLLEVDDDPAAIAATKACLEAAMVEGFRTLLPDAPITGLVDVKDGANWAAVH
jgi:DNA polymerase-1